MNAATGAQLGRPLPRGLSKMEVRVAFGSVYKPFFRRLGTSSLGTSSTWAKKLIITQIITDINTAKSLMILRT